MTRRCFRCARDLDPAAFTSEHAWCRECVRTYNARPEQRAARRAYMRTPAGRAAAKRYEKTPAGKKRRGEIEFRHRYGITFEDWARAFERQAGRCAGCNATLVFGRTTHVDHCHRSRTFRGLLCRLCNMALGSLRDSPETLRRLAVYVESANVR